MTDNIKGKYNTRVVRDNLATYRKQLETIPKFVEQSGLRGYGVKSYRWVEITAKIEMCESLLGLRNG